MEWNVQQGAVEAVADRSSAAEEEEADSTDPYRPASMAPGRLLEVYLDLLSQPCRAVQILLARTGIPHKVCAVALRKGNRACGESCARVSGRCYWALLNCEPSTLTHTTVTVRQKLKRVTATVNRTEPLFPLSCARAQLRTALLCAHHKMYSEL